MSMTATSLVPGVSRPPAAPLARYRTAQIAEVFAELLKTATRPGDSVLELGVQDATYIREALHLDRRILALNVNPLAILWTAQDLNPVSVTDLKAAVTRLGDQPKEGQPLSNHIQSLYRSRCPVCQRYGVAEWFAWDRDTRRPFAKRVHCVHCEQSHEGNATPEDIELSQRFPAQSGPAYYFALGRVAQPADPLRDRAAELVELYTPRNLNVLMDLIHRITQIPVSPQTRAALACAFLDVLDQSSSLNSYDDPTARPRSLRPAQRYLERNIWSVMMNTIGGYQEPAARPAESEQAASSLQGFFAQPQPRYLLSAQSLRAILGQSPAHSLAALVLHPEIPDATSWALSALWAAWLGYGTNLRGFIGRRRLDWDWYRRSLSVALRHSASLLKPGAPILCLLPTDHLMALDVTLDAISDAALTVDQWIACPNEGFRLLLSLTRRPAPMPLPFTEEAYYTTILQQRAEPTPQLLLEAAAILSRAFEPLPKLTPTMQSLRLIASPNQPNKPLIWLRGEQASNLAPPLADRVEETLLELLHSQPVWQRTILERELYARLSGSLSPEPLLVRTCTQAYTDAQPEHNGLVTLRPQDHPAQRAAEVAELRREIQALGVRLGLDVAVPNDEDILWSSQQECLYLFRCTSTAILAVHLFGPNVAPLAKKCLVIPGGRSALIALKLRRDPRLHESMLQQRWAFVKFRHLRRMLVEVSQRSEIEVYLGLDPIVEREQAQIPLPLH